MASFEEAYKITKGNEGGYVFDPRDSGGETYKGIARKYHPLWPGWKLVDNHKKLLGGKIARGYVIPDTALNNLVTAFYKTNFWKLLDGDNIKNQQIANLIFDFGVNGNTTTVITFVEKIIQGLGFSIRVDGKIDPVTLKYLNEQNPHEVYSRLKARIKEYYEGLATKNPAKYGWALESWRNRLARFPDVLEDIKKKV
ncbi:MAG TPA: glycosyl hydrolase 108 family protein [Cytophagaceae bacterium]|jgi:lysozyme family protein